MSDGEALETGVGGAAVGGDSEGDGVEAVAGCCPAHACPDSAGQEVSGGPYPLYDAPRFASFAELVAYIGETWGDSIAFETADEQAVSYHELVERIERERMEMDEAGEGRFVEVLDTDPVQFAARYLAVVSSGRCAVLCRLTEEQKARLARAW